MAESKHTPGPWWVDEDGMGEVLTIVGPRENCTRHGEPGWEMARIDNSSFWDNPETEAEDRANADLIAAAPDLLEALELMPSATCVFTCNRIMLVREECDCGAQRLNEKRRAALAKAKGETP